MSIRLMNDPNAVAVMVRTLGDDESVVTDGLSAPGATMMDPEWGTTPDWSSYDNADFPPVYPIDVPADPIDLSQIAPETDPTAPPDYSQPVIDPNSDQFWVDEGYAVDASGAPLLDSNGNPLQAGADGAPIVGDDGNFLPWSGHAPGVIGVTTTDTSPQPTDSDTSGILIPPDDPISDPIGSFTSGGGSSSGSGSAQPKTKPVLRISVSPAQISPGQSATLAWQALNATSVEYNGHNYPPSGSMQVKPSSTTKYTMTAHGPDGTDTESATLTIGTSSNPLSNLLNQVLGSAPTINASASPSTIPVGSSTRITWSTKNATSVIANGQSQPVNGSVVVAPLATTTYTLTATDVAGKTASTHLTITVAAAGTAPSGTVTGTPTGSSALIGDIEEGAALVVGVTVFFGLLGHWHTTRYNVRRRSRK